MRTLLLIAILLLLENLVYAQPYKCEYGQYNVEVNDRYWVLVHVPKEGKLEIKPSAKVLLTCNGIDYQILPNAETLTKDGKPIKTNTLRLENEEWLPNEPIDQIPSATLYFKALSNTASVKLEIKANSSVDNVVSKNNTEDGLKKAPQPKKKTLAQAKQTNSSQKTSLPKISSIGDFIEMVIAFVIGVPLIVIIGVLALIAAFNAVAGGSD